LVWPVALLAGSKLIGHSKRIWPVIFALVILVSFAVALILADRNPKAYFYLPFTRAWELALGARVVVLPPAKSLPRPVTALLPVVGLVAIGYSAATLSSEAPFPAINALPPTLGAALVIFSRNTLAQAILGVWPLRFLGLISYSLYLWHWPLIVFWRIYSNGDSPTGLEMSAIVGGAVGLSVFSWRFIEQPARRVKISTPAVLTAAMGANVNCCIHRPCRWPAWPLACGDGRARRQGQDVGVEMSPICRVGHSGK
jgi:peptidoglycan/LPS O-acetylase OafA/YrhL